MAWAKALGHVVPRVEGCGGLCVRLVSQSSEYFPLLVVEGYRVSATWIQQITYQKKKKKKKKNNNKIIVLSIISQPVHFKLYLGP